MPGMHGSKKDLGKEILAAGPVQFTLGSKSEQFGTLVFTLGADPKSASGYRVYAEPLAAAAAGPQRPRRRAGRRLARAGRSQREALLCQRQRWVGTFLSSVKCTYPTGYGFSKTE